MLLGVLLGHAEIFPAILISTNLSPQPSNHSIPNTQVKLSAATEAQETATKNAAEAQKAAEEAAASLEAAEAAEAQAKDEAAQAAAQEEAAKEAAAEATDKADQAKASEAKGSHICRTPSARLSLWLINPSLDSVCSLQPPISNNMPMRPLKQPQLHRQAMFQKIMGMYSYVIDVTLFDATGYFRQLRKKPPMQPKWRPTRPKPKRLETADSV